MDHLNLVGGQGLDGGNGVAHCAAWKLFDRRSRRCCCVFCIASATAPTGAATIIVSRHFSYPSAARFCLSFLGCHVWVRLEGQWSNYP